MPVLLAVGSCGPKAPAGSAPGSVENTKRHRLPGPSVELLEQAGLPTLQLVRREGDPKAAVALAVFPPGGSAGSIQMAQLVSTRLDAAGFQHELKVHGIGFVIVQDVSKPSEVRPWLRAVHHTLHDPVKAEERTRMQAAPLLRAATRRADSLSPYGLCMAELGAEGAEPLTEAEQIARSNAYIDFLEELRAETATAARVGLSALGPEPFLTAAQEAHSGRWIAGDPIDDSWTNEPETAVVRSRGAREIRLALRVADSEKALAGARSLQDPAHPLHGRLHALDPRLKAGEIQVTLRPGGACVGLSVAFDSESSLPLGRVAAAALLATDELEQATHQTRSREEQTLAILTPQGARESAALAAWTAVQSARVGGQHQQILEYRGTETPAITHQALGKSLEDTAAEWAQRTLPVFEKNEVGQAEIWALLASPCGTAPESAEEAGLRALTVSALAQDWGTRHGVKLQPWVSPTGIGIIAHGPRLSGESSSQHAARIVRSLGDAFYGGPLDGRTLASTRAHLLEKLGDDPGLEIVTTILGAGHPSLAQPLGTSKTMATFSVADAERTRADLAQEPLRLAIVTNGPAAQSQIAARALSHWLAPTRDHVTTCPVSTGIPAPPGLWELETIDENVGTGAYVAVFAPTSPSIGRATAHLLNRPGGYLDRAFSSPGLVARAEAYFLGGPAFGGLYLHITAHEGQLDPAIAQARAVLDALATTGIPSADALAASRAHRALEESSERTQLGRLIQLYETTRTDHPKPPLPLSPKSLKAFHTKLSGNEHRVVKVTQRQ